MARRASVLVNRSLYQIAVMTFITAIMWTLLAVVAAINKAPDKVEVDKKLLNPINPTLDMETIELVKKRKQVSLNFSAPVIAEMIDASSSATIDGGGE